MSSTYEVAQPSGSGSVTKYVVDITRMRTISARDEEHEVKRNAKLSAQRLGAEVSRLDLLRQPEEEVPRIERGLDALGERAAANNTGHLLDGWK